MGKANEDEIVLMGQQQQQQNGLIRTIPIQINSHLIFIDDDISDPSTYRDVIHCLATCNENDSVNFLINSNGGRTDSIWQIIEAMKGCRGDVAATVIGAAYSAASMLACMAPQCLIADSAEFMLHTAHYGSIGCSQRQRTNRLRNKANQPTLRHLLCRIPDTSGA